MAVRHNAVLGLAPLLFFLSSRLGERVGLTSLVKKSAICVVLAVTMFGTARVINTYDARVVNMSGLLMIWDLSAMSVYGDELLVPRVLFRDGSGTDDELLGRIKQYFTSDYCHPVFIHVLNGFVSDSDLPRLFRFWRSMVEDHPKTYFRHRRIVAQRLLGLGMPLCQQYHLPGIDHNDYGFEFVRGHTFVFKSMWKIMAWLRTTIIYRPWPYLAAAILAALSIVIRRRSIRDDPDLVLALMLVVSAVIYTATLFLIAPGTEYRYIVWAVAASMWSLVLMAPSLLSHTSGVEGTTSKQTA